MENRYKEFIRKQLVAYTDGDKILAVTNLMESKGFRKIGYGSYAAIYQGRRDNTVVKFFEPDNCYKQYVKLITKHQTNPHFPKIKKLVRFKKKPFSGLYALKMESLKALTDEEYRENLGFHCYTVTKIQTHPNSLNLSFSIAAHTHKLSVPEIKDKALEWAKENLDFAKCIDLIAKGMKTNCREDLHQGNIMKRGSTWVIIDPYYEAS